MNLSNKRITFTYTNYKGKVMEREVITLGRQFYGRTKYHPEKQLLFRGFCLTKNAVRVFAVKDMTNIQEVTC